MKSKGHIRTAIHRLARLLAPSTVAAVVLLHGAFATASCPSGTYECGSSHCTPTGGVCCASVGREDSYCPSGTQCTSTGCTSASTSGGTGTVTCSSGTFLCGTSHCTPAGRVCCASVGHEDKSCPSGTQCTTSGGCTSGTSGSVTCPSGTFACGTSHCASTGRVCCASVGHEETTCPSGTQCTTSGGCSGPVTCSSGKSLCGTSHCIPTGSVCCASAGYEERYCPSGTQCTSAGGCTSVSSAVSSGSGTCPSGTYACGTSHCAPTGSVCCASVGLEDKSCPSGTQCMTGGGCTHGSAGSGVTGSSTSDTSDLAGITDQSGPNDGGTENPFGCRLSPGANHGKWGLLHLAFVAGLVGGRRLWRTRKSKPKA